MKSKIKIGLIIFFMIIFGYCIVSNAAISTQSKQVKSGEQFTISVSSNVSLASYSVKAESYSGLTFVTSTGGTGAGTTGISNALASGGVTSLATFTFKAPEVTKDTTYTIKFVATGMGDENLSPVSNSNATATITVKAPVVETPKEPEKPAEKPVTPPTSTPTPEPVKPPVTESKSSEARLSNFGIKPNDFSGFKKDKTEYKAEVPNNVAEVEVYATAVDSKAKISGTGKVTLKEGDNTVKVTVTAEDGKTTKTYTLTIKRKTAEEDAKIAGEARLKNLGIKPAEYDFSGFNSEKTQYSAEVPNEVKEIEVYATAMNSKAQITGTGMIELKEGKNDLKIEVIAEDGTKKEYILEITRKESEEVQGTTVEKFGLSKLSIQGLKLSPSFTAGVYEYTAQLDEELSLLDIQAKANQENSTVEIVGNENLQQGENTITILLTNNETKEVVTYQITVNKNVNVAVDEIEQMSWLEPYTWGKEEKFKFVIIIVLIILIISAIILKIKIGRQNDIDEETEFPGADELDRAIAENQELSINEINESETNYVEDIAKDRFAVEEDFEIRARRRGKH